MEKDLNFFFNNNATQPKKKENMRRKKCISYNRVKEKDLFDRSFVFNIYVSTTKNINLFSLERKIFDMKDREMINIF